MKKRIATLLITVMLGVTSFCLFSGFTTAIPTKKFYVNSAGKEAISRMTTVYHDDGGDYVYGKEYSVTKVTTAPFKYSLSNGIDTIIYMVHKLEECVDLHITGGRSAIFNQTAGFIRSINKNYHSIQGIVLPNKWGAAAGFFDTRLIPYTNTHQGDGVSILEYFASYVDKDLYNTGYDNFISPSLNGYHLAKNMNASDPANIFSRNEIDLIHMIASMDGIYEYTGRYSLSALAVENHLTKDLASWLGDLQTYADELAKFKDLDFSQLNVYNLDEEFIDFNTFNADKGITCKTFSAEDLLADIDAMNIIKLFFEGTENSLSDAMLAYYTVVQPDTAIKGNRYDAFISSSTMDLNGGKGYSDLKLKFINEVCRPMNLEYVNGTYVDHSYYSGYAVDFLDSATNNAPARGYAAKLFTDYVMLNSHRFD